MGQDSTQHSERPLHDFIDMEAYDVVAGETYRNLLEQLEAAQSELQQWRDSIATEKLRWRAEEAEEKLAALADCVMKGWTEPAFARGHLHERAVAIAREVLNPASMFAPCEKCGRSSEGVRRETVTQGEVVRPGFKCECGWWNWLDSSPSNQDSDPATSPAEFEVVDVSEAGIDAEAPS